MVKVIIFDYGGVIGNNPSSYIYRAVSGKFGENIKRIKKEFLQFIFQLEKSEISENKFWKKMAKDLNISDYEKLKKIWIGEFKKWAKINRTMIALLKDLRRRKYHICLLSNRIPFYRKGSITRVINKNFDSVIYSFDVGMRKPEKEIYLYILKRLKVSPQECIIIDDNLKNLFYPKKLKMKTIHFKSFPQCKKKLIKLIGNY